jgi:quercetin dioxygenase-like cupin family protein
VPGGAWTVATKEQLMTEQTVIRRPGEGDAFWMLGGLYEVMVSSEESGGALTIMQMTCPAGMGPPPHTHPGSETMVVLDGRLTHHIGDETVDAGPGCVFHIPAGTKEYFEPVTTCRLLTTYLPGGIDKFFAEVGAPAERRELPPPSDEPPDLERMVAVAARYGMDMQMPTSV